MRCAVHATVMLVAGPAWGALIDEGHGLIYDSTQDLIWLKDADSFVGQLATNPNLVDDIYKGSARWMLPASDGCFGYDCRSSPRASLLAWSRARRPLWRSTGM